MCLCKGSRKLQLLKPTDYPSEEYAQRPVEGALELSHVHGYPGNFDDSRQNLCLSEDGQLLIYYVAKLAVVMDYDRGEQRFFRGHNDCITAYVESKTLCVCKCV